MSVEIWLDSIDFPLQHETHNLNSSILSSRDQFHNDEAADKLTTSNIYTTEKRKHQNEAVMDMESEATPRASKRPRDNTILVPLSSTSPSVSVTSQNTGRSSPTKQMAMLEDGNVVFRGFGYNNITLTEAATEMWTQMQDLADGVGILECDEHELNAIRTFPNLSNMDRRRFGRSGINATRSGQVGLASCQAVAEIVIEAAICYHSRESEAKWNEAVHYVVLKTALRCSPFARYVELATLKTASIEPRTLLPEALPKRMVDYAFTLQSDVEMDMAWEKLQPLPGCSTKSWNHTTYNAVRKTPIAISIETKAADQSWGDANPQIAIWTKAQFARLRQIPRQMGHGQASPIQIPAAPVVIVQGHDWFFCLVLDSCMCEDSEKTVILQRIAVGSTRNCFDTYKVLAALQRLIYWAHVEWRPWFQSIISPLSGALE